MSSKLVLSKLEWYVLGLFAVGILCNVLYTHYSVLFVIALYCAGITFELLTKSLWTYAPEIYKSPFTVKGVNLILGLGWVGAILLGLGLAKFLQVELSIPLFLSLIIGIGIVGNLAEQFYHYIGLFTYNLDQKILAWPFDKVILIWGIPLTVRLGYFSTIPFFVWLLLQLVY